LSRQGHDIGRKEINELIKSPVRDEILMNKIQNIMANTYTQIYIQAVFTSQSLSDLMQDIKGSSSKWINKKRIYRA